MGDKVSNWFWIGFYSYLGLEEISVIRIDEHRCLLMLFTYHSHLANVLYVLFRILFESLRAI